MDHSKSYILKAPYDSICQDQAFWLVFCLFLHLHFSDSSWEWRPTILRSQPQFTKRHHLVVSSVHLPTLSRVTSTTCLFSLTTKVLSVLHWPHSKYNFVESILQMNTALGFLLGNSQFQQWWRKRLTLTSHAYYSEYKIALPWYEWFWHHWSSWHNHFGTTHCLISLGLWAI